MSLRHPGPLEPLDKVAVIAPAGPFDRASFEAGLSLIAARYRTVFDDGIFSRHRYLAGTDDRRTAELTSALADESIKAIFCARGGYGSMRLLARLKLFPGPPKLLVGFSDVTALQLFLGSRGWASIHGPVLTQLSRLPQASRSRLFHWLEQPVPPGPLEAHKTLVPGTAEGPLWGGNLAVLTRLLGTPYLPSLRGAVLLLEDTQEHPYQLDRMWTHLKLAGAFDGVAGIALGQFTDCEEKNAPYTSQEVLEELALEVGLPCAAGFPIGHGSVNEAVGLGCRVRLDASARCLEFLEAAVENP